METAYTKRGDNSGMAQKPYRWLARYYDDLFPFHLSWFENARRAALSDILPRTQVACDLGCGTGTTAVRLAAQGIRMYGVDVSEEMCKVARAKARQAKQKLRVVQADMRDFHLPEPVDLVLCEFDALNHVPEKADLGRVFASVAAALRPGGYFYFDVNMRLALESVWPGTWFREQPGMAVVMNSFFDEATERCVTDIQWFLQRGTLWKRESESVEQVCWTDGEIRAGLEAAGLGEVAEWDALPFFTGDSSILPGCCTFYRARKDFTCAGEGTQA